MDAIAIGDTHLGKSRLTSLFGDDSYRFQMEPVGQALQFASQNNIRRAVFLGDVFDKPQPTIKGLLALFEVLFRFDGHLDLHFLLGNHDIQSADKPHSLNILSRLCASGRFKSVHVHEEPGDMKWDGLPVRICPWGHSDPGKAALCFGHFARPGAVRDNGYPVSGDDKDVQEEVGKALWVSGHLHTAQKVGRTYFPGTLFQTSYGEEDGPKHFLRIRAKRNRRKSFGFKVTSEKVKRPFKLATVEFNSNASWRNKLPASKRIRYRVRFSPELRVPDTFMKDNPTVVECRPIGSRSKVMGSDFAQTMASASNGELEYKVTDGLADLLKYWGMKRGEIRRAVEIIEEGIEQLGLRGD